MKIITVKERITTNALDREFKKRFSLDGWYYEGMILEAVYSLMKQRYKTGNVEVVDVYHILNKKNIVVKCKLIYGNQSTHQIP